MGDAGVAARPPILDFSKVDLNRVVSTLDDIRRINPQRYEMEQLTATVYEDRQERIGVGYKDFADDEFWIQGHMPGMPLMPGVLMCEAAAQLCAFLAQKYDITGAEMIGLGGLDNVRIRGLVRPGDRLLIMVQLVRVRRGRMFICDFQGYVNQSLVIDGKIRGIPLPLDVLLPDSGE